MSLTKSKVYEDGELWSFIRRCMSQGKDIHLDHAERTYEEYSARLDLAALERLPELKAYIVRAVVAARGSNEPRVCPSRDADHCDYPDCEQHWTNVVAQARALLEPMADCDPAIRQWLKIPDLPKLPQGASRDAPGVVLETESERRVGLHVCDPSYPVGDRRRYTEKSAGASRDASKTLYGGPLCEDCPPLGYITNKTRCDDCPRRSSRTGE